MSEVRLRGLTKSHGAVVALHPFDLDVAAGELVVLVGPSGCGKTTVLRLIAGLDEPDAGEIWIDGRRVDALEPKDRDVAMVFQNYALYPHMTVRENLGFGLRMRKRKPAEIREKVAWAAGILGLETLLDRRPGQLSGGQRQRVAVGRALVREPKLFLFDEPLSNLDAQLRADTRREIAELHARLGTTMIYVTHDQVEAMTLGDRIAVLRGGRLEQLARPLDAYHRPATLFAASFLGTPPINTVEGEVMLGTGRIVFAVGGLKLPLEETGDADFFLGPATLAVRPEAIRLTSGAASVGAPVEVRRVEGLGSEMLVHFVGPAGRPWIARVAPESEIAPGRAGARFEGRGVHVFSIHDGRRLGLTLAPR